MMAKAKPKPAEEEAENQAELDEQEVGGFEEEAGAAPGEEAAVLGGDEPPPSPSLARLLRQQKLDIDEDLTDEEIANRVIELQEAEEERESLRQRNQQLEAWYAQQAQEAQQRKAETDRQALSGQQQQAQQEQQRKREVPEWDPEWVNVLKVDETTGQIVPKFNWVAPDVVGKYKRYKAWEAQQDEVWRRDPAAYLRDAGVLDQFKQELTPDLAKRLEALEKLIEQQRTAQVQDARTKFLIDNAHHYAALDDQGQPVTNAQGVIQGNENFDAFLAAEEFARKELGITDPQKLLQAAIRMAPPAPKTEAKPKQTPSQRKAAFRRTQPNNGRRIAQEPVQTRRGGGTELVPAGEKSIKSLARNKWLQGLEQTLGAEEE